MCGGWFVCYIPHIQVYFNSQCLLWCCSTTTSTHNPSTIIIMSTIYIINVEFNCQYECSFVHIHYCYLCGCWSVTPTTPEKLYWDVPSMFVVPADNTLGGGLCARFTRVSSSYRISHENKLLWTRLPWSDGWTDVWDRHALVSSNRKTDGLRAKLNWKRNGLVWRRTDWRTKSQEWPTAILLSFQHRLTAPSRRTHCHFCRTGSGTCSPVCEQSRLNGNCICTEWLARWVSPNMQRSNCTARHMGGFI